MKGNGLQKYFTMCKLWPWPWRYVPESRSWSIAWYIIKIQLGSDNYNLWPGHDFGYVCTVTMNSEIWPWVKVMTYPSVIDNKCVKYYPDPTWQWGVMARTWISGTCALWPWPWRYDNRSRSWHFLGSWTTIVLNIIQIQLASEELWPVHGFPVRVHCDLDLGDMALGQGHDTPLVQGQQLCEIISRSDKGVRSYGPDTMWTDGQTDRRTDRQGDSYIPPQTLFARGLITFLKKENLNVGKCSLTCSTNVYEDVCGTSQNIFRKYLLADNMKLPRDKHFVLLNLWWRQHLCLLSLRNFTCECFVNENEVYLEMHVTLTCNTEF